MGFTPPTLNEILVLTGANDGYIPIQKFATSGSISNSAEEDVWSEGGALQYLSVAETINFESTSGSDGMVIVIDGLDSDYNLISDEITLNGALPVPTNIPFFRIYRAQTRDDAVDTNVGKITGTADSSATVQCSIEIERGQTEMSHVTVPAGYIGLLKRGGASTVGNDDATVRFVRSVNGGAFKSGAVANVNEYTSFDFTDQPPVFKEKTDIKVVAKANTNNTVVSINYLMMLVKV